MMYHTPALRTRPVNVGALGWQTDTAPARVTSKISRLSRSDTPALEKHLLALNADDRRLRFGVTRTDYSIRAYVSEIHFETDAVSGVFDGDSELIGAAHLARATNYAELGLSVSAAKRGIGIGSALLAQAERLTREWGLAALFMHCLTENSAIVRLARKQGMAVVSATGETNAWLRLGSTHSPATANLQLTHQPRSAVVASYSATLS